MGQNKFCDNCKQTILQGMPTYFVSMGLKGGFMDKKLREGELCNGCYKKIDDAILKIKAEKK